MYIYYYYTNKFPKQVSPLVVASCSHLSLLSFVFFSDDGNNKASKDYLLEHRSNPLYLHDCLDCCSGKVIYFMNSFSINPKTLQLTVHQIRSQQRAPLFKGLPGFTSRWSGPGARWSSWWETPRANAGRGSSTREKREMRYSEQFCEKSYIIDLKDIFKGNWYCPSPN